MDGMRPSFSLIFVCLTVSGGFRNSEWEIQPLAREACLQIFGLPRPLLVTLEVRLEYPFNFRRSSRGRKYFNDENFPIYGSCLLSCSLFYSIYGLLANTGGIVISCDSGVLKC